MQSVHVSLSETYDLSTRIGKVGCVGVHTPGRTLIKAQWPGLWQNFRRIHIDSCRVVLACASVEPVDPLQVGTSGDVVAPQDMFNPILYRAVSNDSFNLIQNRMKNLGGTSFPDGSIDNSQDTFSFLTNATTQERIYYNLLSDKSWKKAMPQAGFVMDGLYPIVYEVVNSSGAGAYTMVNDSVLSQASYDVGMLNYDTGVTSAMNSGPPMNAGTSNRAPFTMRGASKRMPSVPIHNGVNDSDASNIPCCYVFMLVTPPGKKNVMFYRLKVEWNITFSGLIPITQYDSTALQSNTYVYGSDYTVQSKDADDKLGMADSFDADMVQVM